MAVSGCACCESGRLVAAAWSIFACGVLKKLSPAASYFFLMAIKGK
jgi:hypothetical protein